MNTIAYAYDFLKSRLLAGGWKQGEKLPALRGLAQMCGVSRTTMWRAVGLLQMESLVHVKKRGSIIAGPANAVRSEPLSENQVWLQVQRKIGNEVVSGRYTNATLPPINKLSLRYGVAINTCKKALDALVGEGMLTKVGRRYLAARKSSSQHQASVVLISEGSAQTGINLYSNRTQQVVECFERGCFESGLSAVCEGFDPKSTDAVIKLSSALKELREVRGVIVNFWNPFDEIYRQRWFDLIRMLISRMQAVIVLDQDGHIAFPSELQASRRLRVLRIAGTRAGEIVAESLIRQGRRKIAYVTPFFSLDWSKSRYQGLCRYCSNYGGADAAIELHESSEIMDINNLTLALMNLDREGIRMFHQGRYSDVEIQDLQCELDRSTHLGLIDRLSAAPIANTVRRLTRALVEFAKAPHDAAVFDTMRTALHSVVSAGALEWYLQPFFEKVLASSRANAWVCSEDATAINALSFLRRKSLDIPGQISVVGFDNWQSAYEARLSSFDFNMNGMVRKALLKILDEKELGKSAFIEEIDGYVVDRKTTNK